MGRPSRTSAFLDGHEERAPPVAEREFIYGARGREGSPWAVCAAIALVFLPPFGCEEDGLGNGKDAKLLGVSIARCGGGGGANVVEAMRNVVGLGLPSWHQACLSLDKELSTGV